MPIHLLESLDPAVITRLVSLPLREMHDELDDLAVPQGPIFLWLLDIFCEVVRESKRGDAETNELSRMAAPLLFDAASMPPEWIDRAALFLKQGIKARLSERVASGEQPRGSVVSSGGPTIHL